METSAIVRGVRLSAQKGRLVADLVRGKPVDKALNILTFTQKKAAVIIKKALESAIANAEHNDGADIDELRVTKIHVEKAKTLLNTTDKSMKEICTAVGYSDPNYFSRSFKKNTGETPTEYRGKRWT